MDNLSLPYLLAFVAALVLLACCGNGFAQSSQPNIIFIMVDDAGVGDFSSYTPSTPVQTPNLDALAADGMRFTSAYAGATVCGPSRSVLLTGQHMGHTRVRGNFNSMLHDADVTIGEVLQEAGYATGGFGKWGVGMPGTPGAPERQGFDTFVGYLNQIHAHSHYPTHIYEDSVRLDIPENAGFSEPETGLVSNSRVHAHNVIVSHMQGFIEENAQAEKPFFAYGAWTPPHRRSTLPQAEADPGGAYAPYASESWPEEGRIQAAFISLIDRQVGEIRQQINDLGIADNTLILFASDNGGWSSDDLNQAYDRNEGLRGYKTTMYEGGVRTPLIAYWDGQVAAGTTSDLITYFPDLMPTFAELAEATEHLPNGIDGYSIVPTLLDEGTQSLHTGIYFDSTDNTGDPNSALRQSVRMGDWKLIRSSSGYLELYNLSTDPEETSNVRASNPTVVAQLTSFMDSCRDPMYPQFRVTGVDGVTGVVANGIRPGVIANRNWEVAASGDARSLTDAIVDEYGTPVDLFVNDLHQEYQVELSVNRAGAASPELLVEFVGASGIVYYSAVYDTSQQAGDSVVDVLLDLDIMDSTPSESALTGDSGSGLTLRISHAGGIGEIFVDAIQFAGGAIFADLNFDDVIDADDWAIQRGNMFADLSSLDPLDAYAAGDLNDDGFNNGLDFLLFRDAYNAAYGASAFEELISGVPEPSTFALLCIVVALLAGSRPRR